MNNFSRERNGSYHEQPLSKKRRKLNHASAAELDRHIIVEDPTSGHRQENHRPTVPGIIESDRMIVPSKFTTPIAPMVAISRVDNRGYFVAFFTNSSQAAKTQVSTKPTEIQNTSEHSFFSVYRHQRRHWEGGSRANYTHSFGGKQHSQPKLHKDNNS